MCTRTASTDGVRHSSGEELPCLTFAWPTPCYCCFLSAPHRCRLQARKVKTVNTVNYHLQRISRMLRR